MEGTLVGVAYDAPTSSLSHASFGNGDGSGVRRLDLRSPADPGADALIGEVDGQAIRFECLLVVADGEGREQATLPVAFRDRKTSSAGAEITGSDPSGAFQVSVCRNSADGKMTFALTFELPELGSDPIVLLRALETYQALGRSHNVGLWMSESGRWASAPIILPSDIPPLPPELLPVVRVIARIRRLTGSPAVMPRHLSEEDVRMINWANALLSGNTVYGTWQKAAVIASSEEFEVIRTLSAQNGARVEIDAEQQIEVAGLRIELGRVINRVLHAVVETYSPSPSVASGLCAFTLRPGSDNRVEVELQLSEEDRANLPDGRLNTLLETYAGRWVAQDGARILFDADSPEDVIEELRRRGEIATVWRVPASKLEASARPVFA